MSRVYFEDLFGFVVFLNVKVAVQVAFERLCAVEEVVGAGRVARATVGATAAGGGPLPGRARRCLARRLPFAEQFTLPVDLFAQRSQLLLPFGQLLKSVAIGPVLLEGGAHPLRHELAEPKPVLHAPRPGLFLLDGRLFNQQSLDHVDALLNGSLLLVDHLLLGRYFGRQLLVGSQQFVYPILFQFQLVLLLSFVGFNWSIQKKKEIINQMFPRSKMLFDLTGYGGRRWTGTSPTTCHSCDDGGNTGNGACWTSPPTCASGRTVTVAVTSGDGRSGRRRGRRSSEFLVVRRRCRIARRLHQSGIRSYCSGRRRHSSSGDRLGCCRRRRRRGTCGRRCGRLLGREPGRARRAVPDARIVDWNATCNTENRRPREYM